MNVTQNSCLVDSAKPHEVQTVYIKKDEERIVLVGTNQHRGGGAMGAIGGVLLRKDVNKYIKMMFVHQALRKIWLNKNQEWTVLLCTEGYTPAQIHKIKEYFSVIPKPDGSCSVRYIKEISSLDEILHYLNQGDENRSRNRYIISRLLFYCHGNVRGISPWMGDIPTPWDPYIDRNFADQLESHAFAPDAKIYSLACRTGLGNEEIDQDTDGKYPMPENSVAQALADATGASVYAYLRRTWYGDSLLDEDEKESLEELKNGQNWNDIDPTQQEQYDIWYGEKYLVDGEILYPKGARHPIRAADTPRGLDPDMKTYRRREP